jgi:membrane protein DedA with SNARE-associated domain
MTGMEERLCAWVEGLSQTHPVLAYGFLALSAVAENLLPPVPGDLVVVFSAYLVGRGALSLWPAYLATCLGGTLGFLAMFGLGRQAGARIANGGGPRWLNGPHLARAQAWLSRYGVALLLANRFLSGIRSVIAVAAGMAGMRRSVVGLCAGFSMLLWNGALFALGALVGREWQVVRDWAARLGLAGVAVLALVVALSWLLRAVCRRRRRRREGRPGDAAAAAAGHGAPIDGNA